MAYFGHALDAAWQHPAPKPRQKRRSNFELKKAQLAKEEQKLKGLESAVHAHLVAAAAAGKESAREARQASAARVQAQVQLQQAVVLARQKELATLEQTASVKATAAAACDRACAVSGARDGSPSATSTPSLRCLRRL